MSLNFFLRFYFIFREGEGRRKGEKCQSVVSSIRSIRGLAATHACALMGIKPVTLSFAGPHSTSAGQGWCHLSFGKMYVVPVNWKPRRGEKSMLDVRCSDLVVKWCYQSVSSTLVACILVYHKPVEQMLPEHFFFGTTEAVRNETSLVSALGALTALSWFVTISSQAFLLPDWRMSS